MNLEFRLIAYVMSGLVDVRYMKLPTNSLYSIVFIVGPLYVFLNFVHVVIGVFVGLQLVILKLEKTSVA